MHDLPLDGNAALHVELLDCNNSLTQALEANALLIAENRRLREVLEQVVVAATRQLEGHGKGIPPSQNLQAAFDAAEQMKRKYGSQS